MTLSMAREKTGWRVDLVKSLGADKTMTKFAIPLFTAMGNAANDVASEIDAGKYPTHDAALSALQSRTSAAFAWEAQALMMKQMRDWRFWANLGKN